jgi:hypothetical protein
MNFQIQRDSALALLARTDLQSDSYAPMLVKLLWSCGLRVRPPHFMSPLRIVLLYTAWFAPAWGLMMWAIAWASMGLDLRTSAGIAVGVGLLYGVTMAIYYSHGRKKYGLPAWDTLAAA